MIKLIDILNKLSVYIKSLNKNTIVFILGALFMLLFLRQCNQISSLKQELKQTQQISDRNLNNYKASLDTIQLEKNSKSQLIATIRSYEFEVGKLTEDKSKLIANYNKALNIKKETEKINSIIAAELQIKDSIINANYTLIQMNDTLKFRVTDNKEWDKYNWRRFSGEVDILKDESKFSVVSNRFDFDQGVSLQTAIVKTPEGMRLKITSPYPGLEFTRIENINLVDDELNRPKVSKAGWSLGVGVGYGFNLNSGQVLNIGPSIGIGLYWSPRWLRF